MTQDKQAGYKHELLDPDNFSAYEAESDQGTDDCLASTRILNSSSIPGTAQLQNRNQTLHDLHLPADHAYQGLKADVSLY